MGQTGSGSTADDATVAHYAAVADAPHPGLKVGRIYGRYEVVEPLGRGGLAELELALTIMRGALGPEHPNVALCHNNLGGLLREMGDHARAEAEFRSALEHAQRGFAFFREASGPPQRKGDALFVYARLQWNLDQRRPEAIEIATNARVAYA